MANNKNNQTNISPTQEDEAARAEKERIAQEQADAQAYADKEKAEQEAKQKAENEAKQAAEAKQKADADKKAQEEAEAKAEADRKAAAKSKPVSFEEGVRQCSGHLVKVPNALDFSVKKTEAGRHYYSFDNDSSEAVDVREQVTSILKEVYNNGMYSYGQFATALRVDGQSIQALLDEDFREQNNL